MSSDEEEVLPSFDLVEIDDTMAEARTARILKARQAATTYSAKIEEAGWFNSATVKPSSKAAPRPELFALHHLYCTRDYSEVVKRGLNYVKKAKDTGADSVELFDLVLRAGLKSEEGITMELVELARRYHPNRRAHSGLSHTASLVLSHAPPSLHISSLEALEASLSTLPRNVNPYTLQVIHLLKLSQLDFLAKMLEASPHLRWEGIEVEEFEKKLEQSGISLEGGENLRKSIGKKGEIEEEVVDEARTVRNL